MSGPRIGMRPGFNWSAVGWEGPDETPGEKCSYCDAPIGDEQPLVMWNRDGWAMRLCDRCVDKWVTAA